MIDLGYKNICQQVNTEEIQT